MQLRAGQRTFPRRRGLTPVATHAHGGGQGDLLLLLMDAVLLVVAMVLVLRRSRIRGAPGRWKVPDEDRKEREARHRPD